MLLDEGKCFSHIIRYDDQLACYFPFLIDYILFNSDGVTRGVSPSHR